MEENKIVIRKEFFIRETEGQITEYYEVLKKIGEGGFSKVYKVREKETGEIRGMKEVNKSKITNVNNFKTEIKILAMLDHPNILRLFEVIEDSKSFYLIMELCTGGELLSRMTNNHYKEKEDQEKEIISKDLRIQRNIHWGKKMTYSEWKEKYNSNQAYTNVGVGKEDMKKYLLDHEECSYPYEIYLKEKKITLEEVIT